MEIGVRLVKTLILILVTLGVIGFFGFYFFSSNEDEILSVDAVASEISVESRKILDTLNELKALEIKGDVFKEPAFQSLVDISIVVNQEPKQRPNPFAPITGGSSSGESTLFE